MPPKRDPIEAALIELARAPRLPSDEACEVVANGLSSRHAAVVAAAAVLAHELELRDLEPALLDSYDRLAEDPETLDPVCAAMKEIVAALFEWGSLAPEVYLRGAGHVQFAGWDNQDVGAPLRGLAVQALVKVEHPEALTIATDMLDDGLPPPPDRDDGLMARVGAATALRALASEASAHVLRLKVLSGDPSPAVLNEGFAAMLEYCPAWLEAVARFLVAADDAIAITAALAIAEARPPGALEHLQRAWEEQRNPNVREAVLQAIASLRSDEAVEFLVELVRGESMTAMRAMSALTLYAASEAVVSQVRAAAKANKRPEVGAMFQRLFGQRVW